MIQVVDYDPAWPAAFEALAARLRAIFDAAGLSAAVEHVGSTSVPGLAAKPVLDIDVVVSPADLSRAIEALTASDMEHRGEKGVPGRHAFRPPPSWPATPSVNLYLCEAGALALRNHLAVRDVLRADAALRDEYARVKRALAATPGVDMGRYVEGKSGVLGKVLAAGGIGGAELAQIEEVNRDTR
ncbi:monooxygenase [Vanrija albida]|uniref:Monooxygenase n=1 Tax=Vanrija albida TaxID=181172 RepID=A0ABR3Q819_9TREE